MAEEPDSFDLPPVGNNKPGADLWNWLVSGAGVIVLLMLLAVYTPFLGARFAPGLRFAVTGPDVLAIGQANVVTWDTSPENQRRSPSDKIEFCQGRLFGEKCVTLNPDTPNDGEALVFVPSNLKPGKGFLRMTARRRPGGELVPSLSATRPVELQAGLRLTPGQRIVLGWKPDTRYKEAKVEFCTGDSIFSEFRACHLLAYRVANTGRSPEITVGSQIPGDVGVIRMRARNDDGELALVRDDNNRLVFVEQPAVLLTPVKIALGGGDTDGSSGDSDSGDNGGGGDDSSESPDGDGGAGSTPTPEATPESTPEATPEVTPDVTSDPDPTPESTPETSPDISPEPSSEPTPDPTPEATPEATPEVTPTPSPVPTPTPSSEPTPDPTPEPEPFLRAEWISPEENVKIALGQAMDVRVYVQWLTGDDLLCHIWFVDDTVVQLDPDAAAVEEDCVI